MKYLANFADEFGGKNYEPGDEVKGLDEGTIDFAVKNGRLTVLEDGDAEVTAIGSAGDDAEKPKAAPKK